MDKLLIVIFVIRVIFCYVNNPQFCHHNYVDSVIWDGFQYEISRNNSKWIAIYDQKSDSIVKFYVKTSVKDQYIYQSGYYIPDIPQCNNTINDCENMSKLKFMRIKLLYDIISKKQFESIRYFYENNEQIRFSSGPPFGLLSFSQITDNEFWPKGLQTPGQTYKPSAFWPKKYLFIYILNRKEGSDTPILITNSLTNNNWTDSWKYTKLRGYKEFVFSAAFWWRSTDSIYVIAEQKHNTRNAQVFRFDQTNPQNPFIPTGQRVVDFFGCNSV